MSKIAASRRETWEVQGAVDPVSVRRAKTARLANLLIPGSGMILLRREWLGLAISLLFAVVAQFGIAGLWIVPSDFPRYAGMVFAGAAIAVWVFAQWLTGSRIKHLSAPELENELSALRSRALAAMSRSDHGEARRELLLALSVDDESAESVALWARLMEAMGRSSEARRAWRRAIKLGAEGEDRREAEAALDVSR